MRTLAAAAIYLLCSTGFAQTPPPAGPLPSVGRGLNQPTQSPVNPMRGLAVTQSSRVRAFNVGPDGQVQSIYLANGNVVDVPLGFGPDLNAQLHKGARIHLVGSRTYVHGQTILTAQQLTIGQQSFTAQSPAMGQAGMISSPAAGTGMPPPPPNGRDGGIQGQRRGPSATGLLPPPPPPPGGGPVGPAGPPFPPRVGSDRPGSVPPPPPNDGNGLGLNGQQPGQAGSPPPPAGVQPGPTATPIAPPSDSSQASPAPPSNL